MGCPGSEIGPSREKEKDSTDRNGGRRRGRGGVGKG